MNRNDYTQTEDYRKYLKVAQIYTGKDEREIIKEVDEYQEKSHLKAWNDAFGGYVYHLGDTPRVPWICADEIIRLGRKPSRLEVKALLLIKEVEKEKNKTIRITIADPKVDNPE